VNVLNDRIEVISRTNSDIADWLLVGAGPLEQACSDRSPFRRRDGKSRKHTRKVSRSLPEGHSEMEVHH
jgi:hypothetical protein